MVAFLASGGCDYSGGPPALSSSYGVPASDSYSPSYSGDQGGHGDHGGHETVKRHIGGHQGCCGGGSSGYGGQRGGGGHTVGQYHGGQPSGGHPGYGTPAAPPQAHSGGGRPSYSGGRPDYAVHPQGYGGYGLSTKPYQFGYSVQDRYSGADFKQQETSDGNTVKGQYRVALPDGRTQIVTYTADWQTGFHADVKYEGEASYPAVYGVGGSYPPSSQHGGGYGGAAQPSSGYGAPSQPSGGYGAPSQQHQRGYLVGSSYQQRVGVAGTGSQYNNIGHSPGGSYSAPATASYGHPGYRK